MSTAASLPIKHPHHWHPDVVTMVTTPFLIVLTIVLVAAWVNRPSPPTARAVSVAESGQAMLRAGAAMRQHGQALVVAGQKAANADLVARGERWLTEGDALVQGGIWLVMDPKAPASLQTTPANLASQGTLGELLRTVQAMRQDPSQSRVIDLDAARWAALSLRAQGQVMVNHGRIMLAETQALATSPGLSASQEADLRAAARTLGETGAALIVSAQSTLDYVAGLRRSMAYP